MHKFAMWRALGAAYGFLLLSPLRFLGAFWVVIALSLLLGIAVPPIARALLPMSYQKLMLVAGPALLLEVLALTAAMVALHRAILLEASPWRSALSFAGRHLRYLAALALIGLSLLVAIEGIAMLSGLIAFFLLGTPARIEPWQLYGAVAGLAVLLMVPIWWVAGRYLLALPAAAVGEGGLRRAWEWGRGNGWTLFLGSILCILPFWASGDLALEGLGAHGLAVDPLRFPGGFSFEPRLSIAKNAVVAVLGLAQLGVLLAFYSDAYRQLRSSP